MQTNDNSEIPRLSVDEETKQLLEDISESFKDAMIDFIKLSDLKSGLQETEMRLKGAIESGHKVQARTLEAALQRLLTLEEHCAAIEKLVRGSESNLIAAIQESSDKATTSSDALKRRKGFFFR